MKPINKMNKKIAILGNSGHAFVVLESLRTMNMDVIGYFDKQPVVNNPFQLNFLGFEADKMIDLKPYQFVLGIGDNNIRKRAFDYISDKLNISNSTEEVIHTIKSSSVESNEFDNLNSIFLNVVDISSNVSHRSSLGFGNYVGKHVCINSFAQIGSNCILNTGCIIEHECLVGNHSHIAPGSVLLGNVKIGSSTLIGANSTVLPGIIIGDNVVVGAGSVVTKNIPNGGKWIGNKLIN